MKNITLVDSANSVSLMEWNLKTSLHWDWENLVMLNASATDMPQKLRPTVWGSDGGLDSGSIYSSGAGGSSGNGSDLGLASLSKSSKSASISSSSLGDCKGNNKFTLDGFQGVPNDFSYKKDFAKASPPVEVSVGSGEPLLDLKLGKRTYSEDVCAEKNAQKKNSSSSMLAASSVVPPKRTKAGRQTTTVLRCQVEGCNLDLSSAKDYHRKHRVCEDHAKTPKVIVAGLERRFCQQCSRFHSLSEFDEKKRSCRRRLSDHNARRRKPQTESVAYNAARLSVSPYDAKHEISFVWNRSPFAHTRPPQEISWESMFSSKSTPMKSYAPAKVGSANGELQLPGNESLNLVSICHCDSAGFIPSKHKHSATEVLHQDEESRISSSTGMPQDLHRALSLLSTDSWGSCEPKQGSLDYSMTTNETVISQPVMHAMSQGFPLALSENWQVQPPAASQAQNALHNDDGDNHFQDFHLFRAPYGGAAFYPNRIN